MAGLNRASLIGRLGRDPEVRTMPSGGKVVTFSLATDETWKDKNTGERKQRTEWHQIVIYNEGLGGVAEQYLRKGSQVYIEGQIGSREYTDKEGQTRRAFEIVLRPFRGELVLLGSGSGGGRHDAGPDGYGQTSSRPAGGDGGAGTQNYGQRGELDDDIPF